MKLLRIPIYLLRKQILLRDENKMKIFTFFSIFFLLSTSSWITCQSQSAIVSSKELPQDCGVKLLRVGQCLDKMLLIMDDAVTMIESQDMFVQNFCLPFNGWAKCVLDYRPCLRPFQRSILSLIIYNTRLTSKKLCKTEYSLNETWSHLQCLTPDGQPVVDSIKNKVLSVIDYAINGTDAGSFLSRGCCAINTLMDDVVQQLDDYCLPRTGKASGKFVSSLISTTFNDILSMMCGSLPDVKTCQEKLPQETRELQYILSNPHPTEPDVVLYILKMMAKLDQVTNADVLQS